MGSIVFIIVIYVVIGLIIYGLLLDAFNIDYPLLCVLFWPLLVVVELVIEIKELIEDIIDGTLF